MALDDTNGTSAVNLSLRCVYAHTWTYKEVDLKSKHKISGYVAKAQRGSVLYLVKREAITISKDWHGRHETDLDLSEMGNQYLSYVLESRTFLPVAMVRG